MALGGETCQRVWVASQWGKYEDRVEYLLRYKHSQNIPCA